MKKLTAAAASPSAVTPPTISPSVKDTHKPPQGFVLAGLGIVASVFYLKPLLGQPFVMDDWLYLSWFELYSGWDTLTFGIHRMLERVYLRPLQDLYMFAMYHFFGLNPQAYLGVNFCVNVLAAYMTYRLSLELTGDRKISFLTGVLYISSFHILEDVLFGAETIHYAAGSLCLLLCLWFALAGHARRACFAYLAGLLFHEGVFFAPLIAYVICRSQNKPCAGRVCLPMVVAAGLYIVLRLILWPPNGGIGSGFTQHVSAFGVGMRDQFVVFADHLAQTVTPIKRVLVWEWRAELLSKPETARLIFRGVSTATVWGSLGLGCLALLRHRTARPVMEARTLVCLMVWMLLALLPFAFKQSTHHSCRYVLFALPAFLIGVTGVLKGILDRFIPNPKWTIRILSLWTALNAALMFAGFEKHSGSLMDSPVSYPTELKVQRGKLVRRMTDYLKDQHPALEPHTVILLLNRSVLNFQGSMLPMALYRDRSLRVFEWPLLQKRDGELFIENDPNPWLGYFDEAIPQGGRLTVNPERLLILRDTGERIEEVPLTALGAV